MAPTVQAADDGGAERDDPLTGLGQKADLLDRLGVALAQCSHDGSAVGLVVFGIDGFRHVNAEFGHEVGDLVLGELGRRLAMSGRAADATARLSGDEFAVVCPHVDPSSATRIVERLRHEIERPITVDGTSHQVRATMGVVVSEPGGGHGTPQLLLRSADLAMHRAKDEGLPWVALSPTASQGSPGGPEARSEGGSWGFTEVAGVPQPLRYQPLVDLVDDRMVGAWAQGVPGEPHAVIEQFLADRQGWDRHSGPSSLRVWLEVPASWLARPGALRWVEAAVGDAGVRPEAIGLAVLDIGELGGDPEVRRHFTRLVDGGLALCIDAVDVVPAALAGLLDVPFSAVALPAELAEALQAQATRTLSPPRARPAAQGLLSTFRSLSGLGRELGLDVIARGVDVEGLDLAVSAAGGTHAVGELYGPSVPADRFADVVRMATTA